MMSLHSPQGPCVLPCDLKVSETLRTSWKTRFTLMVQTRRGETSRILTGPSPMQTISRTRSSNHKRPSCSFVRLTSEWLAHCFRFRVQIARLPAGTEVHARIREDCRLPLTKDDFVVLALTLIAVHQTCVKIQEHPEPRIVSAAAAKALAQKYFGEPTEQDAG